MMDEMLELNEKGQTKTSKHLRKRAASEINSGEEHQRKKVKTTHTFEQSSLEDSSSDTNISDSSDISSDTEDAHSKKTSAEQSSGEEDCSDADMDNASAISDDTEDTLSEETSNYILKKINKGKFPFEINSAKRGKIGKKRYKSSDTMPDLPQKVDEKNVPNYVVNLPITPSKGEKKSEKFQKIFKDESFGFTQKESEVEAQQRLSVAVGVNKMKSVFTEENQALKEEIDTPLESTFPYRREGFFWKPQWHLKTKSDTREVGLGTVRKYFIETEDRTKHKIEAQIKEQEKKDKLKMIPYRKIRETLKNSETSKELVAKAQKDADRLPDKNVYMGFIDGTVESLHAKDGMGVFSHYDEMLETYKEQSGKDAVIASTGYRISSKKNPMLAMSVEVDMAVRTATNNAVQNSIYIPEPNFIAQIEAGKPTLEEKFTTSSTKSSWNKDNYESPMESPILVNNIIKKRGLDPDNPGIIFDGNHAIQIEVRKRMLYSGKNKDGDYIESSKKKFNGSFNNNGLIVHWNSQDFKHLRNLAQSHYKPMDWGKHILRKYKISKKTMMINKKKYTLNQKTVELVLTSLLSRLFNAYDPVAIANQRKEDTFVKNLIDVLEHYVDIIPNISAHEGRKKKKNNAEVWQYVDRLNNLQVILETIKTLLDIDDDQIKNINEAAQNSGDAVFQIFKKNLCLDYGELVIASLEKFVFEVNDNRFDEIEKNKINNRFTNNQNDSIHDAIIHNAFGDKIKLKRNDDPNVQGKYGMSYLHLAAISGNTLYVEKLLQNKRINKNIKAVDDILPIHCAIKYCIQHGTDIALIKLLADKSNIKEKVSDGRTALYFILTELENPIPILELFHIEEIISPQEYALLKIFTETLEQKDISLLQRRRPLTQIIDLIDDENQAIELVQFFITIGGDANERYKHDDEEEEDSEIDSKDLPIFAAIKRDSCKLVEILGENGADFTEINDEDGCPPMLSAMNNEADLSMIETLFEYGGDFTEPDEHEETYPIHEAISPVLHGKASIEILKYIIEVQPETIDIEDGAGNTPLQVAIEGGNEEAIELLVKSDIDINEDTIDTEHAQIIRRVTGEKIYSQEEVEQREERIFNRKVNFFISTDKNNYFKEETDKKINRQQNIAYKKWMYENSDLSPFDEMLSEYSQNDENDSAMSDTNQSLSDSDNENIFDEEMDKDLHAKKSPGM